MFLTWMITSGGMPLPMHNPHIQAMSTPLFPTEDTKGALENPVFFWTNPDLVGLVVVKTDNKA